MALTAIHFGALHRIKPSTFRANRSQASSTMELGQNRSHVQPNLGVLCLYPDCHKEPESLSKHPLTLYHDLLKSVNVLALKLLPDVPLFLELI